MTSKAITVVLSVTISTEEAETYIDVHNEIKTWLYGGFYSVKKFSEDS